MIDMENKNEVTIEFRLKIKDSNELIKYAMKEHITVGHAVRHMVRYYLNFKSKHLR